MTKRSGNGIYFLTIAICIQFTHATGTTYFAEECPGREVTYIRQNAEEHELSVVFYYVSWDHESREARNLLNDVAHYYYDQVYFSAIDCWHLACNCSQTHTVEAGLGLPYSYPTMFAYFGRQIKLQYHGEWTFVALAHFLNNLFKPLERVHNKRELKILAMKSDAVILGLFANANSRDYSIFTASAVRWLETDPDQSCRFAVAFGRAAENFIASDSRTAEKSPQIMLIFSKSIEMYNNSNADASKFNSSQIIWWLQTAMKRSYNQINGYNAPSSLAIQLRNGPVLTIFANDYNKNANFYTIMENLMNFSEFGATETTCKLTEKQYDSSNIASTLQMQHEIDQKELFQTLCYRKEYLSRHNMLNYFIINAYFKNMLNNFKPDVLIEQDTNSAVMLSILYESNKCLRGVHNIQFKILEMKTAIAKFVKKSADKVLMDNLTLVPKQNRTLGVSILDASKYADFLHIHDIYLNVHINTAKVFIIDPKKESIFVMQEKFSYHSVLAFIKLYYENNLISAYKLTKQQLTIPLALNAVYVHEFNRQMFLNVVNQQNVTSVVFLYSPACAFSSMSQALIQIAGMLESSNNIQFIRFNTQTNDLPWEFQMSKLPTLIIFPRGSSMESRIFPAYLKANVRNIYGFILAQLQPIDQAKLALSSCKHNMPALRQQKCLQFVKTFVMQHIGHHLKFWQIFDSERHFVLDRLKQFKDISLDIQRSFRS